MIYKMSDIFKINIIRKCLFNIKEYANGFEFVLKTNRCKFKDLSAVVN